MVEFKKLKIETRCNLLIIDYLEQSIELESW